ncbi:TetR/AcrR family transcriptional regulator [Streptomyces pactum]|uniref:TetR/AcrR family transcriptional regulator n=1 Tax=Streptomyces pactum TaxID=68249 RepID=A0ABS0NH65_9ACTN|nr:TetR/AcrR family transcriptional regulator [Streptomyces pactum]
MPGGPAAPRPPVAGGAAGPPATSGPAAAAPPAPSGAAAPGRPPGRPRDATADGAIIEAVLRLLEEGATIGELSMERIAREAGVGKATLYRRWRGKEALMLDVMRSLDEGHPEPAGESVRDDLVTLLEFIRRRALAKRHSALLRAVVAHVRAHPGLWKEYHDTVIQRRRELLLAVLRRGMAAGEIRATEDLDLLADLFVGPMLTRAMMHEWRDLPDGLSERIVDTVLDGVRSRN